MGKIRPGLTSLVMAGALALGTSNANSAITFRETGVWSLPRVYEFDGTKETEVDYSSLNPDGSYRFKTQIVNEGSTTQSSSLLGEIIGPEYSFNNWEEIELGSGSSSTRYWSDSISNPGDYVLRFTLGDGTSIERDFTVVPEASTLALLALGLPALKKRKKE